MNYSLQAQTLGYLLCGAIPRVLKELKDHEDTMNLGNVERILFENYHCDIAHHLLISLSRW
jgi:hypothetical protein